jgi:hypothetical protein
LIQIRSPPAFTGVHSIASPIDASDHQHVVAAEEIKHRSQLCLALGCRAATLPAVKWYDVCAFADMPLCSRALPRKRTYDRTLDDVR